MNRYANAQRNQEKLMQKTQEVAKAVDALEQRIDGAQQQESSETGQVPRLAPELVTLIEKACACPAEIVRGDGEAKFLSETAARMQKHGDRIRLSEKQLAWLRRIAVRVDAETARAANGEAGK